MQSLNAACACWQAFFIPNWTRSARHRPEPIAPLPAFRDVPGTQNAMKFLLHSDSMI